MHRVDIHGLLVYFDDLHKKKVDLIGLKWIAVILKSIKLNQKSIKLNLKPIYLI